MLYLPYLRGLTAQGSPSSRAGALHVMDTVVGVFGTGSMVPWSQPSVRHHTALALWLCMRDSFEVSTSNLVVGLSFFRNMPIK